jgi:hypothetical protein
VTTTIPGISRLRDTDLGAFCMGRGRAGKRLSRAVCSANRVGGLLDEVGDGLTDLHDAGRPGTSMTLLAFARLWRRSHAGGIALPRPATSSRTGSSPGYAIDLGEPVAQAAVRETLEGTPGSSARSPASREPTLTRNTRSFNSAHTDEDSCGRQLGGDV